MSAKFSFQVHELHALHTHLRAVFLLLLLLTLCIVAYIAVRVFVLTAQPLPPAAFAGLCILAAACVGLCIGQLCCLRRMRHDAREKAERLTFADELTGALSCRYLEQRLGEEIQRAMRHGYPLAVVYLDLDGFRMVNDTYGHEAGNEVLRRVSQVVRGHIRREDLLGRLGGDEFLVVLPHTDESGALVAGERLRTRLAAVGFTAPGGERLDFLGFSMGAAGFPAHGNTCEKLIQAAGQAMCRAKQSGGDRVCL